MVSMGNLEALVREGLVQLVKATDVPGAVVAVAAGGTVADAVHGVVSTVSRYPVRRDTLFPVQSITKLFTATLVMQLVDAGRIALNSPVQAYLPEFHTRDLRASEAITVEHLLTHTGGFEGDLWEHTTSTSDALDRFVRDVVADADQYSAPGSVFSYCSAGFGVLGRLVEVVRGLSYEEALRTFLLDPLGVGRIAFSASQALAYSTAIGHVRPTPSAPLIPTREWALLPPSNPAAGNQLALHARGLLTLGQLVLSGGVTPSGERLLSETSVQQMLLPRVRQHHVSVNPWSQGLGWRLPGTGVAQHAGGAPGVASLLTVVPDHDVAVVVLTNSGAGSSGAGQLSDRLVTELAGIDPAPDPTTPAPDQLVADPALYVGTYANRQMQSDVTSTDDGRLWLTERPIREGAAIYTAAGCEVPVSRNEIRPVGNDVFAVISGTGVTGSVSFLDAAADGSFRLLAGERVASRQPLL